MDRLDYDRGTTTKRTGVLQVLIAVIAMAPSIYMAMCGWCVWFWSFAAEPSHTHPPPPHLVRLLHYVLFLASPLGIAALYVTAKLADKRGFAWVWLNWVVAALYVGIVMLVQHLIRVS